MPAALASLEVGFAAFFICFFICILPTTMVVYCSASVIVRLPSSSNSPETTKSAASGRLMLRLFAVTLFVMFIEFQESKVV